MIFVKVLFITVFIAIVLLFLFLTLRTSSVQGKPEQKSFLAAKFPAPLPQGFYKGSVKGINTSWQGKKFDSSASRGINVFNSDGKKREAYPFKTYKDSGLRDKNSTVLRIDYNISENPFWLRFIVDEIREEKPGEYLGKVHIRILPNLSFTLGYFNLKKQH